MSAPVEVEVEVQAVEIEAELRQIRTMADGSTNIVLNLPEYCREQVKVMLDWVHLQVHGVIMKVGTEKKKDGKYGL